ncbi:MAG TPA: glycosyltransferase [Abditibacteriaceae bacterium]
MNNNSFTSSLLEELTRARTQIGSQLRAELESRTVLTPRGDDPDIRIPRERPRGDRSRLRIGLMADTYLPIRNGVTHMVALTARILAEWGHEPHIFTFAAPGAVRASLHGHDGIHVHHAPGLPVLKATYYMPTRYPLRLKRLLRDMDILHVHHPFISGRLAWRKSSPDQPIVFTNHTRYDMYSHYVHRVVPFLPEDIVEERLTHRVARFANRCDAVISPSASVAGLLHDWGVRAPIETIPNGIVLRRFQEAKAAATSSHGSTTEFYRSTRARLGLAPDDLVAVFLGRMAPEKSVDTLLRAFALVTPKVPRSTLLLIAAGPLMDEMRALARELGITDRVRFAGGLPYDEVPDALACCDLFVSASVSEVHPLTFIEAMAAGLASVGTPSPGVADTIRDGAGGNGWLAEATPECLAAAISEALLNGEERTTRATQASHDCLQYSIETTVARTLELYNRVLDSRVPSTQMNL